MPLEMYSRHLKSAGVESAADEKNAPPARAESVQSTLREEIVDTEVVEIDEGSETISLETYPDGAPSSMADCADA